MFKGSGPVRKAAKCRADPGASLMQDRRIWGRANERGLSDAPGNDRVFQNNPKMREGRDGPAPTQLQQ